MKHSYINPSHTIKRAICGALLLASFHGNAQTFSWIKEAGDNNRFSWAQSVAIDHHHNEIVSGFQNDSTHFGGTILPFYGNFDAYIAKYDSSGNLLWANDIGGTDADKAYNAVVDDSDNIYVVGGFMSDHLRFSATDSLALTAAGNENFFLAKYDKNGNFLWARNGGKASPASYACRAKAVALNSSGNIVIGGYYAASMLIAGTSTTLPGTSGTVGLFVAEYSADGTFLWANNLLSNAGCAMNALACDNAGNVFATGKAGSVLYNGTDTVVRMTGGDHLVLFKYNALGAFQWIDTLGKSLEASATDNTLSSGNDLILDNTGNIYLAGNTLDSFYYVYDTALSTYEPVYQQYGFVAKYANTGAQTWIQKFGGDNIVYQGSISESDQVNGIALDAAGDIYAVGDFVSNTTFGGLAMTTPSTGTGFIGKFSPATGDALWLKTGGGQNGNQSLDIAIDQNGGGIATTGTFQGFVQFDATTVSSSSTALTYQDVYLARQFNYVPGTLEIPATNTGSVYNLYPNPASEYVNIDLPGSIYHKIMITTMTGQTIATTQTNSTKIQLDIKGLAPGNYTVSVIDDSNNVVSLKLVKM